MAGNLLRANGKQQQHQKVSRKGEQTTEQQQQTEQKKVGGKKCDSKPAPAGRKPKKAEAVLTKDEIQRVIDLGLGRGMDATNPKPWLNKSSFQVRRVAIENVIGTEEGGALQSYKREVTSVQTQQTDLKASVTIPQSPVTIGVDAEQSRSVSSRRRADQQDHFLPMPTSKTHRAVPLRTPSTHAEKQV